MRNRHFPRLCQSCQAPIEAQEDICWKCETVWVPAHPTAPPRPEGGLRLIDSRPPLAPSDGGAAPAERRAGLLQEAGA
jgi:hypothetical protein